MPQFFLNPWRLNFHASTKMEKASPSLLTLPMIPMKAATYPAFLFANKKLSYPETFAHAATSVESSASRDLSGPKHKCSNVQKSQLHSVRFRAGELSMVKLKAQRAGVSTNSYIRASTLGSDYRQPIHLELQRALLASNRELTAQGNNLNQIARHLNSGTASPAQAGTMLDFLGRSMLKTHKAVREALVGGRHEGQDG